MPHSSSPESSPHAFDFADLGRPRPKAPPSARALPPVPAADASGELDELGADDILECDDIASLEAAAAGIRSFEAPPSEPSGFEVGEVGAFDEVEVEGVEAAPPSLEVDYTAPSPSTLVGIPAAPSTSPLPLESIIVDDAFPEKTLELRGNAMSKVAAAAATLDASEPQQTEVLVRSAMPAALQTASSGVHTGGQLGQTPPPTSIHTPSSALVAAAPAWPNGPNGPNTQARRPGSIAPVELDVAGLPRAMAPSVPAHAPVANAYAHAARPVKKGMSGLAIGGIVFAAVAFVGLVGAGGFAASRAFSDKPEAVAVASSDQVAAGEAANGASAASPTPSETQGGAAPSEPASGPATLDVSALPSAPAPGSAPRGFTGSGSFTTTGSSFGSPAPAVAGGSAPAPRANHGSALAAPGQGPTSSGIKTTALPPPGAAAPAPVGAGGSTLLPPPVAAPARAPAPAAVQPTTGVVRVDPNLRAVVVDGSYRRASDGVVTLSCGTHRVKAGMKEPQTVNVPCGGSVSL